MVAAPAERAATPEAVPVDVIVPVTCDPRAGKAAPQPVRKAVPRAARQAASRPLAAPVPRWPAAAALPRGAIPSGEDDDIIARRLRKAAEAETDPELKEKLWKEYRDYKENTRGGG